MQVAFDRGRRDTAMKIRAVDDVGAYAGRSPFQLGSRHRDLRAVCDRRDRV